MATQGILRSRRSAAQLHALVGVEREIRSYDHAGGRKYLRDFRDAYRSYEETLTPEQVRIYDAYAGAFGIIHNNLDAAMRAANITGETGTLNAQAKSAARSAFESAKQRFFGHLLTSMKTPSLIRSIERDLDARLSQPARR